MNKPSSDFEADVGKKYSIGKLTVVVEDVLAEGGYGVVFRTKSSSGQKFALKRLYVNEEAKLVSCKREIQIMRSLSSHKNIVSFVDSAISKNYKGVWEVLILMQFYPGTCMKLVNDSGAHGLSENVILNIFCDTCEAVARLHHCQTPILHRDLKIENLLIEESGSYVLCDFGSATARSYIHGKDDRSPVEMEEDINKHTTLSHRAPEMVNLYGYMNITTKADIWALGVTLYRLCFRSLPFGESTLAIQSANLTIPENSQYSKTLHSLISFCLEPNPERRPDIYQVSRVAFAIAKKACPVKNISSSVEPDISDLLASFARRTSRSTLPSTPKNTDRSGERIERTTVTPRERPKASRSAAGGASAVSRQLIVDGKQDQPQAELLRQQQLQQQQQIQQQQQLQQQQQQQLHQQHLQQQQQLAQMAFYQQQQALYEQQQQQALYEQQQQQALYEQQQQQALYEQQQQQQALYEQQQQQALYEQQQQQALYEQQQQQALYEQQQQQALYEQQQQQALHEQQHTLYQRNPFEPTWVNDSQNPQQTPNQQIQQTRSQIQQTHTQILQTQAQIEQYQQAVTQQQTAPQQTSHTEIQQKLQQAHLIPANPVQPQQSGAQIPDFAYFSVSGDQTAPFTVDGDKPSVTENDGPSVNAFEDDFGQAVLFTADFSSANGQSAVEASQDAPSQGQGHLQATDSSHQVVDAQPEFKVPSVPEKKSNPNSSHDGKSGQSQAAPNTRPSHRRNHSDTSAIAVGRSGSAFRVYEPNRSRKKSLAASLSSLNSISDVHATRLLSVARSKSEATSLSDTFSSAGVKSSSVEGLPNWNPFADDADSIADDAMFGQEFDRLRCGSQSSIQNVKSREDLVMMESGLPEDPFSAAPFYYKSKGKSRKESKTTDKYSRLSATSDDNLLAAFHERSQPQKIFGVPIPFTRRSDRYKKVRHGSNESLTNAADDQLQSSDEDLANATLQASQFTDKDTPSNCSSNSGTLTRSNTSSQAASQHASDANRSGSCDSNPSTITPAASSSENVGDPFGAAPFGKPRAVQVDDCPVPLLPNNPFLTDIIVQKVSLSQQQLPVSHESAAAFGAAQFVQPHLGASAVITAAVNSVNSRQFSSLPRMPKSKTIDSIHGSSMSSGDHQLANDVMAGGADSTLKLMKRSQTDYQVASVHLTVNTDSYEDNLSEGESLISSDVHSAGKKEKSHKSPRVAKAKSPRASVYDNKKSLAGEEERASDNDEEAEGALTNVAFSEQDNGSADAATPNEQTTPRPPAAIKPHPPTTPKPAVDRRPPVAVKPKVKPEAKPVVLPEEVREDSRSVSPGSRDSYKTHKRYSSYDIATGRAELTPYNDSDSKSALVSKDGAKPKRKSKIGLGIF